MYLSNWYINVGNYQINLYQMLAMKRADYNLYIKCFNLFVWGLLQSESNEYWEKSSNVFLFEWFQIFSSG